MSSVFQQPLIHLNTFFLNAFQCQAQIPGDMSMWKTAHVQKELSGYGDGKLENRENHNSVWFRNGWLPTAVFLPGEFHQSGALWATVSGVTDSWTQPSD